MIKSVTIPQEGNGYLFDKWVAPKEPNKKDWKYIRSGFGNEPDKFDKKRYDKDYEYYTKQLNAYTNRPHDYLVLCAPNLIGRTFNFEPNKVNLIFGPNASGKTTLLKMIAGEALVENGFTHMLRPIISLRSIAITKKDREADILEGFKGERAKLKENTSVVDWDGTPIYYHNFAAVERIGMGVLGGMSGNSMLGSFSEEMMYRWNQTRTSMGQQSMFFLNKLITLAQKPLSMKELLEPALEDIHKNANDTWVESYEGQYNFFKNYPMFDKPAPITMLFDELDKSLDIEKCWLLYSMGLPKLVEEYGVQIIVISHNPLVLTDAIYNNPLYNVISIDEEYTKNMKEMLNGVKF